MGRRKRSSYPNPRDLSRRVEDLVSMLKAIPPMYGRLHDMTGTAVRVESVHVKGGGAGDPTGELAMPVRVDEAKDPEQQVALGETETERRRRHARRVANDLDRMLRTAGQLVDGLTLHVGPTPGYRQPTTAKGGWLTQNELAESLAKQEARLRAGLE